MAKQDYEMEMGEDMCTAAYWERRTARMNAEIEAKREYQDSPEGRAHALEVKADALMNPDLWGGPENAEQAEALREEAKRIREDAKPPTPPPTPEQEQAIADGWTKEVTAERRSRWNSYARVHKVNTPAKGDAAAAVLGYTFTDIRKYVAIWK